MLPEGCGQCPTGPASRRAQLGPTFRPGVLTGNGRCSSMLRHSGSASDGRRPMAVSIYVETPTATGSTSSTRRRAWSRATLGPIRLSFKALSPGELFLPKLRPQTVVKGRAEGLALRGAGGGEARPRLPAPAARPGPGGAVARAAAVLEPPQPGRHDPRRPVRQHRHGRRGVRASRPRPPGAWPCTGATAGASWPPRAAPRCRSRSGGPRGAPEGPQAPPPGPAGADPLGPLRQRRAGRRGARAHAAGGLAPARHGVAGWRYAKGKGID
jgi:hypothetical protein